MELKFEGIYHLCMRLARRCHVGLEYNSHQHVERNLNRAGIRIVMRDG